MARSRGRRLNNRRFQRDLAEVEATLYVLVEAELEAQHELAPHVPPVDECPICRRLGMLKGA